MSFIFKNTLRFTILYLFLYVLDSFFKNNEALYSYRYFTKLALGITLLVFYLFKTKQKDISKKRLVIYALSLFIIGDVFFITGNSGEMTHFVFAAFLFIGAKICYSIRFLNSKDFKISKLIPFLILGFAYMTIITDLVYNNLGHYFFPFLIYLFVVLLLMQFAYLRKSEVNGLSFWLVLFGVFFSMIADSINILKIFYDPLIAYNKITVMFFYCLSQYMIILGVLKESRLTDNIEKLKVNT
ncbi:lysoplasmalogenase family protein [Olleya sp. Ti.3.14]|uniref:lysoplasmalogenase family protein n=1 Tax=Olleya sp. Ti.3.14 TaxID=3121297 RepID=UPI00311F95AE